MNNGKIALTYGTVGQGNTYCHKAGNKKVRCYIACHQHLG